MDRMDWARVFDISWLDLVKGLVSAAIIVLVTRIQEVNDRASALLIALPLSSVLAMIWMHSGGQSSRRIANHAEGTFWFILPTLPMFLLLPWLLRIGWGFWVSLGICCLVTALCFRVMVVGMRGLGVNLLP